MKAPAGAAEQTHRKVKSFSFGSYILDIGSEMTPFMNMPNKLTLLRIILIPVFVFFMLCNINYNVIYALIVFVLASLTDALDGYLARKYERVTTFGKLMDPIADKMLTVSALICFLELDVRFVNSIVIILIIFREFMITGLRLIAISENKVIAAGGWGKLKTIFQIVTIIAIMVDMIVPLKVGSFDLIMWLVIVMVVITVYSGIEYLISNIQLLKFK